MSSLRFVYRSHYEGPLSRRVRTLASSPSIVAWFGRYLERARHEPDVLAEVEADLGGRVYGLASLFEAARTHKLKVSTTADLRRVLRKHLYVEGGPEAIQLDAHSLRVRTNDDEVALAYFFFDDHVVAKSPDRLAYLLHEELRLPPGDADGGFESPVVPRALNPGGTGAGTTYVCLHTFYDGDSIPGLLVSFPGVRLPGLLEHLRSVEPAIEQVHVHYQETWPIELRVLRGMVEPDDRDLSGALRRVAAYPLGAIGGDYAPSRATGPQVSALPELRAAADGKHHSGDPSRSIVHVGEHAALFAMHASESFGYQQWVFFDDRWAAAHPALASSLLRYTTSWDPLHAPARKRPAAPTPAQLHEREWEEAVDGRAGRAYRMTERYGVGDVVEHAKFGTGVVRTAGDKVEVLFRDATRALVHGRQ
jgi:hypothetical protein